MTRLRHAGLECKWGWARVCDMSRVPNMFKVRTWYPTYVSQGDAQLSTALQHQGQGMRKYTICCRVTICSETNNLTDSGWIYPAGEVQNSVASRMKARGNLRRGTPKRMKRKPRGSISCAAPPDHLLFPGSLPNALSLSPHSQKARGTGPTNTNQMKPSRLFPHP